MVQRTEIHNLDAKTLLDKFQVLEDKIQELSKANKSKQDNDKLMTRKGLAILLDVSLATIHNWTNEGIIIAYKIGNQTRYKKEEVLSSLQKIKKIK